MNTSYYTSVFPEFSKSLDWQERLKIIGVLSQWHLEDSKLELSSFGGNSHRWPK